jgi:hypothetical protein
MTKNRRGNPEKLIVSSVPAILELLAVQFDLSRLDAMVMVDVGERGGSR